MQTQYTPQHRRPLTQICSPNQQGIRHGKEDGMLRRMHTNAVVERGQEGHLQPGAEDADSVV